MIVALAGCVVVRVATPGARSVAFRPACLSMVVLVKWEGQAHMHRFEAENGVNGWS